LFPFDERRDVQYVTRPPVLAAARSTGAYRRRFWRYGRSRPQPLKEKSKMLKQIAIAISAAFALSALPLAHAQNGDVAKDTRDIRQDRRDIHRDQRERARDNREAHKDAKAGDMKDARKERREAKHETRDIHKDRHDLRADSRDRRHDVRKDAAK
jgi:hypothetical protein